MAQHYVPRSYLKRFSSVDEEGKEGVWVYDKGAVEDAPAFRNVSKVLAERKLYTLETSHPDGLTLEQQFSVLEGRIDPILEGISQGGDPEGVQEFEDLMRFIAASHFRVPRTIDHTREFMTCWVGNTIREFVSDDVRLTSFLESRGQVMSAETIKRDAERFEDRFRTDRESALAQSLAMIDSTAKELGTLKWRPLRLPKPRLITSDSPVCVFVQRDEKSATFGGGFGLPGVEISFPISPTLCMFGDRKSETNPDVFTVNWRTALNAERYIIAHEPSDHAHDLVRRSGSTKHRPALDRSEIASLYEEAKQRTPKEDLDA
jgi:hypothetical protein